MRIILGLWLLQAVSVGAAWLAFSSGGSGQTFMWVGLVMGIGLLAALWFGSALHDQRRLGEAQRSERTANGVAELHAKLARQRAEDAAKLQTLAEKAASTRPSMLKAGFVAGAALGLGVALVLTQLLTLGLVAVALAGGGVAGYVVRGRLHRRAVEGPGAVRPVAAASAAPAQLPKPSSKILALRSSRARAA